MLSRTALPIAILLCLMGFWIASVSWMSFTYADTMRKFDDLPGIGLGGWLILAGILAGCAAMVASAVVLLVFARRDRRPGG